MSYSGQNAMDHCLKVFGKVVNEIVVRCLCSVFQKLMKVAFKNLPTHSIANYKILFFYLLKTFIYCALFSHFI